MANWWESFQRQTIGFVPHLLNPKTWIARQKDIKGGAHQYKYLIAPDIELTPDEPGMLQLHPNKMELGMTATVFQHVNSDGVTIPAKDYILFQKPTLDEFDNYTALSLVEGSDTYYLKYWQEKLELPLYDLKELQYAPSYLESSPLFDYIATQPPVNDPTRPQWDWEQANWTNTLDADLNHEWYRFRYGTGLWSRPIRLTSIPENWYVEHLFKRAAIIPDKPVFKINGAPNSKPDGWFDSIPSGTDKIWRIWGQMDVYGILQDEWMGVLEVPIDLNLVRYSEKSDPDINALVSTTQAVGSGDIYDLSLTANGWISTPTENSAYKAQRAVDGSGFTLWVVTQIKGESGEYKEYIYKRFPYTTDYEDVAWLAANRPTGERPIGWEGEPQPIKDNVLDIYFMSYATKYVNGKLKGGWSDPVPNSDIDTFSDKIRLPLGNNFRLTNGVATPERLTLEAELYLGNRELWLDTDYTIEYSWYRVFNIIGGVLPTEDDGIPETINYPPPIVDDTNNYILTENDRILQVKHTQVDGKAVFMCKMTVIVDPLDPAKNLVFTESIDLLDVTDGNNAVSLGMAADQYIFINKVPATGSPVIQPASITLTAYHSNIDILTTPLVFEVKNLEDANYTALDNNLNGIVLTAETLTIASTTNLFNTVVTRKFRVRKDLAGSEPALEDVVSINKITINDGVAGDRYNTTSADARDIPTTPDTSVTFTVEQNLSYIPSQSVIISNSASVFFNATVTSYNKANGELIVSSTSNTGTGTFASWNIGLAGAVGLQGDAGADGAAAIPILAISDNESQIIQVGEDGAPLADQLGTTDANSNSYLNTEIIVYDGDVIASSGIVNTIEKRYVNGVDVTADPTTGVDAVNFGIGVFNTNRVYLSYWGTNVKRAEALIKTVYTKASVEHIRYTRFTLNAVIDYPGAIIADIDSVNANNRTFGFTPANRTSITLQASLYENGVFIPYSDAGITDISWFRIGASSVPITSVDTLLNEYVILSSGKRAQLVVKRGAVNFSQSYQAIINYKGKSYGSKVLINDITDAKTYRRYSAYTGAVVDADKPLNSVAYNSSTATVPSASANGLIEWSKVLANPVWETLIQDGDTAWSTPRKIGGEQGIQGNKGDIIVELFKESATLLVSADVNTGSLVVGNTSTIKYTAELINTFGWSLTIPLNPTNPVYSIKGYIQSEFYDATTGSFLAPSGFPNGTKPLHQWYGPIKITGSQGVAGANGSNGNNGADGLSLNWKGDMPESSVSLAIAKNDGYAQSGSSYIANAATTFAGAHPRLEDVTQFDILSRGLNYRGNVVVGNIYYIGDIVNCRGSLVQCISKVTVANSSLHTSDGTFPLNYHANNVYWKVILVGFNSIATPSTGGYVAIGDTLTYKPNSAVYRCKTGHQWTFFDESKWELLFDATAINGIYWRKLKTVISGSLLYGTNPFYVVDTGDTTSKKLEIEGSVFIDHIGNDTSIQLTISGSTSEGTGGTIDALQFSWVKILATRCNVGAKAIVTTSRRYIFFEVKHTASSLDSGYLSVTKID